jgi:hypothetical protein
MGGWDQFPRRVRRRGDTRLAPRAAITSAEDVPSWANLRARRVRHPAEPLQRGPVLLAAPKPVVRATACARVAACACAVPGRADTASITTHSRGRRAEGARHPAPRRRAHDLGRADGRAGRHSQPGGHRASPPPRRRVGRLRGAEEPRQMAAGWGFWRPRANLPVKSSGGVPSKNRLIKGLRPGRFPAPPHDDDGVFFDGINS